jgi:hypothetical protein
MGTVFYSVADDILVWIRIWIRGSLPMINGSGCGSGSCIDLQDANIKQIVKKILKVHLHHFSKIKSQKEVTKQ